MKVTMKDIKDAPNLQALKDMFHISEVDAIIAYGDAIYAPNKTLTADLLVHEMVHCERQGFNPESAKRWYEKYMGDPQFRLAEEVAAYRQQYFYCTRVYKDRNRQAKILHALAMELSSARYGSIVSHSVAKKLIGTMI